MNTNLRKDLFRSFFYFTAVLFFLNASAFADTELAKVNGKVITLEEFNGKFARVSAIIQSSGEKVSKSRVLADLIKKELSVQKAKEMKLDQDPEVQDSIDNVIYGAYIQKIIEQKIEQTQVTDDEAKSWFSKNPDIRTRHIFIAADADATPAEQDEAMKRAKTILADIRAGKISFTEAAQKFSESLSAPNGGDLGYQSKANLEDVYYKAAIGLKKAGSVSDIVKTQFGYQIVQLVSVMDWKEADKLAVKRNLQNEKRQKVFDDHYNKIKNSAKITVNSKLLQ